MLVNFEYNANVIFEYLIARLLSLYFEFLSILAVYDLRGVYGTSRRWWHLFFKIIKVKYDVKEN